MAVSATMTPFSATRSPASTTMGCISREGRNRAAGYLGCARRMRRPRRWRSLLADSHGRIATDLRVSLTDRCNLRCAYCMPAAGLDWLPSPELLTDDEVVRLARIGVEQLGITEIRFTGGEPLLRRG